MKNFLLKFSVFFFIVVGIAITRWIFVGSELPENDVLKRKIEILNRDSKINTVFIGSSKINNQVIPKTVDSLAIGVHSFNLGVNGSFNLENFETIDYLLEHKPPRLKIIVLELQNKFSFNRVNINTPKSYQVLSPNNFSFAVRYHYENNDIRQIVYTFYSVFLDVLDFNIDRNSGEPKDVFVGEDGFFALDDDLSEETKKRRQDLVSKPSEITRRIEALKGDKKDYTVNAELYRKILSLKEDCLKKNVQLILVFPAPAEPDAKTLIAFEKKSPVPVIDILDPDQYPQFYYLENRWDYGHLNKDGAKELSKLIGVRLNELVIKRKIN